VVVAYSPFESTALFWIAQDKGFFAQNGLDVTVRKYDSGAASLEGVLKGEADIAIGVTEFPLVRQALLKKRVRAIAAIDTGEYIYVVARKDRGITKASDLKGRRVGTTVGTIADFYLGRFLELNGLSIKDVRLVDVKTPTGWVNAVADGEVDAISTAQPYADAARKRLGDNAVSWSAQSRQPLFALAVATDEWIAEHPRQIERFLKAMARAEDHVVRDPADAKVIAQKALDLDAAYIQTVWSQNQYALSLDQSLILAMEDEARWLIKNRLTTETAMPDFADRIYADGLRAVRPEAVDVTR